jgi:hypothetical protein
MTDRPEVPLLNTQRSNTNATHLHNRHAFTITLFVMSALMFGLPTRDLFAAEFKTPLFGGAGGNRSYNLDCGAGSVIVGVTAKTGMFVDAIGLI